MKISTEEFTIRENDPQIEELLMKRTMPLRCASCNKYLYEQDIVAYLHDNGWTLRGWVSGQNDRFHPSLAGWTSERFWLSIECPQCGYRTSFNKLGIRG